jgi:hypothetical protein
MLRVSFANPKSRIFGCPRLVKSDIPRLDVAMDDPVVRH